MNNRRGLLQLSKTISLVLTLGVSMNADAGLFEEKNGDILHFRAA